MSFGGDIKPLVLENPFKLALVLLQISLLTGLSQVNHNNNNNNNKKKKTNKKKTWHNYVEGAPLFSTGAELHIAHPSN